MTSTEHPTRGGWNSVRAILEGLILAGILWLASSTNDQGKATIELQTQLKDLTEEIASLRGQLADVPALSRDIATLQVKQDENTRRITRLEDAGLRDKGWTR